MLRLSRHLALSASIAGAFFISILDCNAAPLASSKVELILVRSYNLEEPSDSLLLHRNRILAGRAGTFQEGGYILESIHPTSLTTTAIAKIPHQMNGLQAVDSCGVTTFGENSVSTIDYCTTPPSVNTKRIDENINISSGAYLGQGAYLLYANDKQLLFHNESETKRLDTKLAFVTSMVAFAGKVWIANYANLWSLDSGETNAVPTLKQNQFFGVRHAFGFYTQDQRAIVAATSKGTGTLLMMDAESTSLLAAFPIGAEPEGMTRAGSCLAIVDGMKKQIYFINVTAGGHEMVEIWDAADTGEKLTHPTAIVFDPVTKQAFLRSASPCPDCRESQSSLYMVFSTEEDSLQRCF